MNGRINSWAIRFDYHMWRLGTYNIIPKKTLVNNSGFDGTGTHFDEKRYAEDDSQRFNDKMWFEALTLFDFNLQICRKLHWKQMLILCRCNMGERLQDL